MIMGQATSTSIAGHGYTFLLLSVLAVASCASTTLEVHATVPRPKLAVTVEPPLRLMLGESVLDRFVIPARGIVGAVTVTGWRKTLENGFASAFPRSDSSAGLWTLKVITADLHFVTERSRTAIASLMVDSEGNSTIMAHGGVPHSPTIRPPRSIVARLDYVVELRDDNGKALRSSDGSAYSRQTLKEAGSPTLATKTCVEVMFEEVAKDFF